MPRTRRSIIRYCGFVSWMVMVGAGAVATVGSASHQTGESDRAPSYTVALAPRSAPSGSIGGPYRLIGEVRPELRGDLIFADGFESGDLTAWGQGTVPPTGMVMFFDSDSCPPGWVRLWAQPRFLVGLPAGGELGGTTCDAMGDLNPPIHRHALSGTVDFPGRSWHYHSWSELSSAATWTSYDAGSNVTTLIDWDNGIDSEGSGYFPFAAELDSQFETYIDGWHDHPAQNFNFFAEWTQDALPYIQLIACEKAIN